MTSPVTPASQVRPRYYTVAELMLRWKVSRTTIWREVRRHRLRQSMIAGRVRFSSSEVERYERES